MSATDKIAEAKDLIEPLRATVLWQNANPNVMKAADLLAALADLADALAQENAKLREQLTRERAEGIREGWRKAASYHEGLAKSLKEGVPENYETNIGIEHHKSSAALFRTAANLTPDVISPTPSPETAP